MQVMFGQERERKLEAPVQIDDVFVGGERQGGGAGRLAPNKVLAVAAVQTTGNGKALLTRLDVVPNWQKSTIKHGATKARAARKQVVSDGLATFAAVKDAGLTHDPIIVNRRPASAIPGGEHDPGRPENLDGLDLQGLQAQSLHATLIGGVSGGSIYEQYDRSAGRRPPLQSLRKASLRKSMPAELCAESGKFES